MSIQINVQQNIYMNFLVITILTCDNSVSKAVVTILTCDNSVSKAVVTILTCDNSVSKAVESPYNTEVPVTLII